MLRIKLLTLLTLTLLSFTLLLAACGGGEGAPAEEQAEAAPPATAEPAGQDAEESTQASAPTEEAPATTVSAEENAPAGELVTYQIVPAESRASYTVNEEFFEDALSKLGMNLGINTVVGSTQQVEGELEFNPETLTLGDNRFVVDISTLESDDNRRDTWIRDNGPRLNIYPDAVFVANSLSGLPDSYNPGEEIQFTVEGDLTIHQVTVPATFDVRATLENGTITGVMTAQRMLTDFGIEPPSFARTLTVDDEFVIEVEFTAVAQ